MITLTTCQQPWYQSRLPLLSLGMVLLLLVSYLALANDTATRAYALVAARAKHEQLASVVATLETDLARQGSWALLEPKVAAMGLVERGGIAYAEISQPHAVARSFEPVRRRQ